MALEGGRQTKGGGGGVGECNDQCRHILPQMRASSRPFAVSPCRPLAETLCQRAAKKRRAVVCAPQAVVALRRCHALASALSLAARKQRLARSARVSAWHREQPVAWPCRTPARRSSSSSNTASENPRRASELGSKRETRPARVALFALFVRRALCGVPVGRRRRRRRHRLASSCALFQQTTTSCNGNATQSQFSAALTRFSLSVLLCPSAASAASERVRASLTLRAFGGF